MDNMLVLVFVLLLIFVFVSVFVFIFVFVNDIRLSGAGGNIRLIWCWISVNGWYVGLSGNRWRPLSVKRGTEPLSPSISQGVGKALTTLQEIFKLNILSISQNLYFWSQWSFNGNCQSQVNGRCVTGFQLKYFSCIYKICLKELTNMSHIFSKYVSKNLQIFHKVLAGNVDHRLRVEVSEDRNIS